MNNCDYIPHQTRKIKPTRRSVSGIYAFRDETAIPFESTLERDFVIRKEFCIDVLDIIPQPVIIPFSASNGRKYTYTPDFLVYYRLGKRPFSDYPKPRLIEVKPRIEIQKNWSKWKSKFSAAYRYAKQQGWLFSIHDESRIRNQALENIKFLERYKKMRFSKEETQAIVNTVKQMGCLPLHYILSRHFMGLYKAEGIAHVWHLLAIRQLDCDITKPLSDFTELWLSTYE